MAYRVISGELVDKWGKINRTAPVLPTPTPPLTARLSRQERAVPKHIPTISESEEWRPVVGFEGLYEVSNAGRVKSLARLRKGRGGHPTAVRERILKPSIATNGYPFLILSKHGRPHNKNVHRLVAQAFCYGKSEEFNQVNHKDGNKQNNTASNLEWVTGGENLKHAWVTGLRGKKEVA